MGMGRCQWDGRDDTIAMVGRRLESHREPYALLASKYDRDAAAKRRGVGRGAGHSQGLWQRCFEL